jgi:hypothetical protein
LTQGPQTQVVYQQETCPEELTTERKVANLKNVKMVPLWGSTLLHADDLPEFKRFPTSYTAFRQATVNTEVRNLIPSLKSLPYTSEPAFQKAETFLPKMPKISKDKRAVLDFEGGEDAAL